MVKKRYLEAGKIVGTHGVRGEVRVQPWCDTPAQFASLKVVYFDEAGTRPVSLSSRVHGNLCLSRLEGVDIPVGELDITLYRDDLSTIAEAPVVSGTHVPFSVEGMTVVLVDDVIFTGRTARAAMEAVIALGRPAKIQLFALIDRGHAELPIKANYVGKHIPTARREIVSVKVAEQDGENSVTIWSREEPDS